MRVWDRAIPTRRTTTGAIRTRIKTPRAGLLAVTTVPAGIRAEATSTVPPRRMVATRATRTRREIGITARSSPLRGTRQEVGTTRLHHSRARGTRRCQLEDAAARRGPDASRVTISPPSKPSCTSLSRSPHGARVRVPHDPIAKVGTRRDSRARLVSSYDK